jgi:hypothetical protein
MRLLGHAACTVEKLNAYEVLVKTPEGRSLEECSKMGV